MIVRKECLFAPAFKKPTDFAVMNDCAISEVHHGRRYIVKLHVDHVSEVKDYFLRGHNPKAFAIVRIKAACWAILCVDEALDYAEELGRVRSLFRALLDVVFFCTHRNGFFMLLRVM